MNKQVILSALEAQLKTKQSEMEVYENDVVKPAYQEQSDKISRWFLENVSSLIPQISATSDRIEIMKCGDNRRWSACTIQLSTDWRSELRSKYAEFNWYSSRANGKETDLLADVQIFGAVASKFHEIENMMISEWHPAFVEIYKDLNKMERECSDLSVTISNTKSQIANEAKDQYKKVGFSCELNTKKYINRNYDTNEVTLEDIKHQIKLQIGRSKWDYVYVSAFKVKELNKYKCTLEFSNDSRSDKEVTITIKRFNEFIDDVFNWQNGGSESDSKYTTDRYNRQYAKKENAE
jgi:hypothetical protein